MVLKQGNDKIFLKVETASRRTIGSPTAEKSGNQHRLSSWKHSGLDVAGATSV